MQNLFTKPARAYSLSLVKAMMTGAAFFVFLPMQAHAQANIQAGEGNFYFFGDSATGQGNWSAIVGNRGDDHFPYSSNNGFARESNGLIWAEMLGRDVDIILDPDASSSNINFAISGAHMTRGGDLLPFGIETGVETQTELFGTLSGNGAISVGANDVAFMLAGGNDFLDRLEIDDPADEIMADVARAAAANVRALADAGVKTIILSEMQPLQYAPQYADAPEVQAALTELVDETNVAMLEAIEAEGLPSDVNVVTMKYGDLVAYMTTNANALGFTNVTNSCYNPDTGALCSTDTDDQNEYLFLDDLHFTERAHQIEAKWWLATLAGANGSAAHQTARMPRIAYEQLDSHRSFVRPATHTNEDDSFAIWLTPISSKLTLKADGATPSTRLSLDGAVVGLEGRFAEQFVLGSALSVGKTKAKFDDGGGYSLKGGALSLYGAYDHEDIGRLSLTVTKGGHNIDDISRVTGVPLLTAQGKTDSRYWDVELAARSTNKFGPLEIDHGIALSAGRIKIDGFEETGAQGLALKFENQAFKYRRLSLDAIFKGPVIDIAENLQLRPKADLNYTYQFGDDDYGLTARLLENSAQPVTIRSSAPTENRFDTGLGGELIIGERWAVSARYARNWASDISDANEGSLTLRMKF